MMEPRVFARVFAFYCISWILFFPGDFDFPRWINHQFFKTTFWDAFMVSAKQIPLNIEAGWRRTTNWAEFFTQLLVSEKTWRFLLSFPFCDCSCCLFGHFERPSVLWRSPAHFSDQKILQVPPIVAWPLWKAALPRSLRMRRAWGPPLLL